MGGGRPLLGPGDLVLDLERDGSRRIRRTGPNESPGQRRARTDGRGRATYDIFEGSEQIQQLVIARAISGFRIE